MSSERFTVHRLLFTDVALGFAALALYTFTLSPGLLPADAGEYQLTGATLGVAHPPGYALYTLVSWLISRAPVSPALAINFLSALLAAFTLVLISRAVRAVTGSAWAGLGAAAMLGLSTTFWAQATTANVRMPAAFAVAWALERLAALTSPPAPSPSGRGGGSGSPLPVAGRGVGGDRSLAWITFALGLAVSHHASTVFLAAVLGLYALSLTSGVLRRPWLLLVGLIPFLAWLYLPLNALFLGGPSALATWDGFLEHILARGFRGDLFFFASA
ncbi:MAG: protein O-mannosyl-transferase family, partial [Anaerolineales bacterium]